MEARICRQLLEEVFVGSDGRVLVEDLVVQVWVVHCMDEFNLEA